MVDSDTLASGMPQWSDAMVTGVDEMDAQHRILVDALAEATVRLNNAGPGRLFEQLTRDLLAYAIYHFSTEEELMRRYGYATAIPDEAAAHLAQHRHFSQRVVALRAEGRHGDAGSRDNLIAFLRDWLINHILTTDRRLGQFICSARESNGHDHRPG